MMNILAALFAGAMPWVIGASLAYFAFRSHRTPIRITCVAAGALIGNQFLAGVAIALSHLGISIFSVSAFVYATLTVICLVSVVYLEFPRTRFKLSLAQLALSLLTAFVFAVGFTISALTPAAGWDTLDYWAPLAKFFIESNLAVPVEPWRNHGTHPSTVAIVSAWWAFWGSNFSLFGIQYIGWILTWLTLVMGIFSYVLFVTQQPTLALVLYLTATIPLESHAVFGGYAELFLATHIALATALISIGLHEKKVDVTVFGIMCACGCIFLKNIGWIYALIAMIAFATAFFKVRKTFFLSSVTVLGIIILVVVYAISTTQNLHIFIGNRELIVTEPAVMQILLNQFFSLFYNQSFSLAPLIFVICFLIWVREPDRGLSGDDLPIITCLLILGLLMASQLTDYGYYYALPDNDTGNSRLTLPFAPLAVLCAASYLREFGNH